MGPIRSPSGESARHEDAQKRLISATAAAQKRRVRGLAYESPAALRGWRSGEQAGTCSAVLGAAGESRERGRGWPPRAAKAKYRTIFSTAFRTECSSVDACYGPLVGTVVASCILTAHRPRRTPRLLPNGLRRRPRKQGAFFQGELWALHISFRRSQNRAVSRSVLRRWQLPR